MPHGNPVSIILESVTEWLEIGLQFVKANWLWIVSFVVFWSTISTLRSIMRGFNSSSWPTALGVIEKSRVSSHVDGEHGIMHSASIRSPLHRGRETLPKLHHSIWPRGTLHLIAKWRKSNRRKLSGGTLRRGSQQTIATKNLDSKNRSQRQCMDRNFALCRPLRGNALSLSQRIDSASDHPSRDRMNTVYTRAFTTSALRRSRSVAELFATNPRACAK